jgi:hypothetical protein
MSVIRFYNDRLKAYRAEYTTKFGKVRMPKEEFDVLVAEYRLGLSALFAELDAQVDAVYQMFGES